MSQCKKMLAVKPDDPRPISGSYIIGGESQLLQAVLWPAHLHCNICISPVQKINR